MEECDGGRGGAVSGAEGFGHSSVADELKTFLQALIAIKSESPSFSPVTGSVPFSAIYFAMRRRS